MKILYLTLFLFGIYISAYSQEKIDLIVAAPMANISHPLFIIENQLNSNPLFNKIKIILWKTPDELRAIILKKQAQIVALPTNVAATLYNKNQKIKLIQVPIWGILSIVSRDKDINKIKDLKGKEIYIPFRSDMPDIILQILLKKNGIDIKKDIILNYVANPLDAVQMLLLRKADNLLLAEPATSMIMRKTNSYPIKIIAPQIFRSVDLQKIWAETFPQNPIMPQAGFVALGDVSHEVIKSFNLEYKKALEWYINNKKEASLIVAKKIDFLTAEAIEDSITHVTFSSQPLKTQITEINDFFKILYDYDPKLIGGKIPSIDFFYENNN